MIAVEFASTRVAVAVNDTADGVLFWLLFWTGAAIAATPAIACQVVPSSSETEAVTPVAPEAGVSEPGAKIYVDVTDVEPAATAGAVVFTDTHDDEPEPPEATTQLVPVETVWL